MNSRISAVRPFRIALLGLIGAVALLPAPLRAAGSPLNVKETWRRTVFGTQIGASGLTVADLDGDGRPEILVGGTNFDFGPNNFWQILRWDGTRYRQIWASPPEAFNLRALAAVQADADPALEILIAWGNEIRLYDGATRKLQKKILTPATEIYSLKAADLDGDGKLELIFCDPANLFVADLATGAIRWSLSGSGGFSLAVGNLDDDAAQEIVVAGASGRVIDGATRQIQWTNPAGFGFSVRLADLAGDGRLEIAALVGAGVRAFDPRQKTQIWKRLSDFGATAIGVGDVSGDAHDEVIYGDTYRRLRVLNGSSGAGLWFLDSKDDTGTSAIAVADPDQDGKKEILWASGSGTGGYHHLTTIDLARRQIEWSSKNVTGPFLGFDFGDVDADGKPEILFASQGTDGAFGGADWFVSDARTFNPEYESEPIADGQAGFVRMVSANVDSDPQREVFLTTGGGVFGALVAFDGKTHAQEWRRDLTAFGVLRTLAIADVDRDGRLELVASVGAAQGPADGLFVYVFDALTGNIEWRSPSLSPQVFSGLYPLRIAQLDDDPQPEIVVLESGGAIRVLDAVKRSVEAETGYLGVTAFDLRDLDGDGKAEIVAAVGGDLSVLDPQTGRLDAPLAAYPGVATSLRTLDLDGDGGVDFLLTSDKRARAIGGAGGAELWQSPDLGFSIGFGDGLFVGDFDGDGQMEFAVSAGSYGLVLYEVRP